MNFKIIITACVALLAVPATTVNGQSNLMQKFEEGRRKQQQMESRYNSVAESKDIYELRRFVSDYPRSPYSREIQKRIDEVELWDNACNSNTIAAYKNYLNKSEFRWYTGEADTRINNIIRAQEKSKWDAVKQQNTIAAYQKYLNDNPGSAYRADADAAIKNLKADQEWVIVMDTKDIAKLRNFVDTYPASDHATEARTHIAALEGVELVGNNNLAKAYTIFSGIANQLPAYAKQAYNRALEYHEYSVLSESSSSTSLTNFINRYPNSQYKNTVSNYLAMNIARNFSDYAGAYDYTRALSLATDNYTRQRVNNYIDNNKRLQKQRRSRYKAYEREKNGGWLNMGYQFADFFCDTGFGNMNIATGFTLRFGNYRDRLNFILGAQIGYCVDGEDVYVPLHAQLKVKVCKTGPSTLHLFGGVDYLPLRIEYYQSDLAWRAGLTFSWKHFDWSFFYRQDFGTGIDDDHYYYGTSTYFENYIGTTMTYYFSLHRD